ncbi:MAG: response regulator [Planctomycetes bacterium]|nr:response regulator [Planctomycetota bacterium]
MMGVTTTSSRIDEKYTCLLDCDGNVVGSDFPAEDSTENALGLRESLPFADAFATDSRPRLDLAESDGHWYGRCRSAVGEFDLHVTCMKIRGATTGFVVQFKRAVPGLLAPDSTGCLFNEVQALAHVGCFEWDVKRGRLLFSNGMHRMYGVDVGAFGGTVQDYLALIHPDDREAVLASLVHAIEHDADDDGFFRHEKRARNLEGVVRYFESRGRVERDESGQPARVVGACRDVTASKRLEEQLIQSQKLQAVGLLAGGVAHDFNNLLTIIGGTCDLLLMESSAYDPRRSGLKSIQDAVTRAAELTSQLLLFSRKSTALDEVVDLRLLLLDCEQLLRRVIGEDVELVVDRGEKRLTILADPGQIERVLINLAANARDAMPRGGRLEIALSPFDLDRDSPTIDLPKGSYAEVVVTDTGRGIDADVRQRMFEPFYTTKDVGDGTGLGLAVVYGIVHRAGGRILVESERDRGTRFRIILPLSEQESDSVETSDADYRRGTEKVLIVEDEASVREVVRESLDRAGYTVLAADSAQSALELVRVHADSLALVLTDVVMPQIDGATFANELHETWPDLKILFMSGYPSDMIERRCGGLPIGDLIRKPFSPAELVSRVRAVLDAKQSR